MKDTWLIQRLRPKPPSTFMAKAERVFGGGMMQMSSEAWELLHGIFGIEYMGAAEFEFGALPKSLGEFSKDKGKLVAHELTLFLNPKMPVYVLCRIEHVEEVLKRISLLANGKLRLKEWTNFQEALDPTQPYPIKTCGWYELNNGFFFFTDKEMWEKTTELFCDRDTVNNVTSSHE